MNSLKGIFIHNLSAKIVSLVAACVLWTFVMNDQNPPVEKSFSVSVTGQNVPEETKITQNPEKVRVNLRAPRKVFASMDVDEIKVFADFGGLESGTHDIHVKVVAPQGADVVSVIPDAVTLTIDPIIQKRFEISLNRTGAPANGFTVANIEPDLRSVTVIGPQSVVSTVSKVLGMVVIPKTAKGDIDINVSLWALDENGDEVYGVRIIPQEITAHVSLARSLTRKVVDVKPTVNGTVSSGHTISEIKVTPARVELAGMEEALGSVNYISTESVSVEGISESVDRVVSLVVPEGITVTNKKVIVHVKVTKN